MDSNFIDAVFGVTETEAMNRLKLNGQNYLERGAGILLPVTSLPSPYGIGSFGKEAYAFVDFLEAAGQTYWQVLPLGPTSYGDSPYQSFSAFSGNPYLIDLDLLIQQGLLTKAEVDAFDWGDDPASVDYARLYENRFQVLHSAFLRSPCQTAPEFAVFCAENRFWLEDYSLYMAVKNYFGGKEWLAWPEDIRLRMEEAVNSYSALLKEEIAFWKFCQYEFFRQWFSLKIYANQKGIRIVGDIPIYVALDSADVWVHGDQFELDERRRPIRVAGVPPDLFSAAGQLWGNPLYDWDYMEKDQFTWWKNRMAVSAKLYDVIRIDHFIGVVNYYSIPAGDDTARNGEWMQGPGEKLLDAIESVLGDARVIAEDLGVVTPAVRRLQQKSGYPGMKLLEYAFDSDGKNGNLPCHYEKNTVVYGGTHDNETLKGFFEGQNQSVLWFAHSYLNTHTNHEIPQAVIRAGYASSADLAVFQMQDFLGLDNRARMNTPSTIGGSNWRWRLTKGELTPELAQSMRLLAELYGR